MVTLKVRFLKSLWEKSVGLLGAAKPTAVYFRTRFGIHTFGMKFPIDVLVLDKNNVVVKVVENLPPNKVVVWPIRFDHVIELPSGDVKKYGIKIGGKITVTISFLE